MLGVTQPFRASTYKCTTEKESETFEKTATSGGMAMAISLTSSNSNSKSGKFWGASAESSSGTSSAFELASSKFEEDETSGQTSENIKTAFLTEYIKMPMRCVRIPYDAMRLSEDAKREIFKITTAREALRFLSTFGSHISCGENTLGGVFFRTISMRSETNVSSVQMFSSAGNEMSNSLSQGGISSTSGGYSGGVFGPKVGGSKQSTSASKSGGGSFKASSDGKGGKTAASDYSYSMNVSSLGPNATTSEEFYSALNQNTGTWAVIDRGDIDYVIPIWNLIHDELLASSGKDTISEEYMQIKRAQIKRACRLMKRVWAIKTQEFLDTPSPPNLPDVIMNTINDFVQVNDDIGERIIKFIFVLLYIQASGS